MLPMHPDHMLKMFHAEQDHLHPAGIARWLPDNRRRSIRSAHLSVRNPRIRVEDHQASTKKPYVPIEGTRIPLSAHIRQWRHRTRPLNHRRVTGPSRSIEAGGEPESCASGGFAHLLR